MAEETQYDVFLSHNSQDKPAVERLARRLADEAGLRPFLDRWHLVPGEPWQEALEEALDQSRTCAVFIGPGGISPWEHEEMRAAIEQRVADWAFRVIPVLLPGAERGKRGRLPAFLTRTTWVEFRESLDDADALHRLVAGIKGIAPGRRPGEVVYEGVCPYRGLQVFEEEHAPLFFGRQAATEWLVNDLRSSRFLAVVGPSGCGKSSLVRAGLVPGLRRGDLPGSETWPLSVFRPGHQPLESLAVALIQLTGSADDPAAPLQLIDALVADQRQLHLTTRLALADAPPERTIALVVDQFEEIFTLCRDEGQRRPFIDNLLYASAIEGGRGVVVLTMRADFYGKCAAYPDLAARITDHQMLVSPMVEEELRQAIERPTQLVGLEFEGGLVETLLRDVQAEPGALPLLQHTLLELWERQEGHHLTFAAYREIGGIQGAIAHRAESIYDGFDALQQSITRRIMLRLVAPGEGTEDTRRRAQKNELLPTGEQAEQTEAVVQTLANARLVTTARDMATGEEQVDVSHEALIRGWPRLRLWIDEDRAGLRAHRRLTEAAQEWERHGRDASYLYRGSRLVKVERWTETYTANLSTLEHDFITASVVAQRAEHAAKRQRQVLRITMAGLLALVIIALVTLLWMFVTDTGPFEVPGEWIQGEGLDTRVNVVALEPQDPTIIYAGTEDRRVLKSFDRGLTWKTVLEIEEEVQSLAASPNSPSILYAGTRGGHLLRSIDSGTNWAEVGKVLDTEQINYLLVDPTKPEILYVCDVGLSCYQSPNDGANWIIISETSNVSTIAVAASEGDGTVLYFGTRDGLLLRSTERGETWQYDPEGEALPYITDIAVSPEDTDLVYVGTIQGLYRFQMKEGHFDVQAMVADLETIAVTVDPLAPHIVFASVLNGNIYVVQQQGDSFRDEIIATGRDFPGSSFTTHLVAGDHNPYFLYAATDKGVFAWEPSRQQKITWFGRN